MSLVPLFPPLVVAMSTCAQVRKSIQKAQRASDWKLNPMMPMGEREGIQSLIGDVKTAMGRWEHESTLENGFTWKEVTELADTLSSAVTASTEAEEKKKKENSAQSRKDRQELLKTLREEKEKANKDKAYKARKALNQKAYLKRQREDFGERQFLLAQALDKHEQRTRKARKLAGDEVAEADLPAEEGEPNIDTLFAEMLGESGSASSSASMESK